jgi:hypothetical protein
MNEDDPGIVHAGRAEAELLGSGRVMPSSIEPSPRLSIVIPAANVAALEDTLVSVLENRPADCEIVVALAVPYDDPWNIADEVRFVQAPVGTSLVGRVNVGVASSSGEIIHVLSAGCRATEGWTDTALTHFDDPSVAAIVPVGVHADDRGRVVAAGIRRTRGGRGIVNIPPRTRDRLESFGSGTVPAPSAPTLEAGFWRADVLARGGFSVTCGDELAAADMAAALWCAGARVLLEPSCRVVWGPSAKRCPSFLAGLHAERLFWRSLVAHSTLPALAAHAVEIVRHAIASAPLGTLPMLLGRLMALVQFGSSLPRAKELRELRAEAATRGRTQSQSQPRTLRIDAGHTMPSRPRRAGDAAASPTQATGSDGTLRRSA